MAAMTFSETKQVFLNPRNFRNQFFSRICVETCPYWLRVPTVELKIKTYAHPVLPRVHVAGAPCAGQNWANSFEGVCEACWRFRRPLRSGARGNATEWHADCPTKSRWLGMLA